MTSAHHSQTSGAARDPHTIIIARGAKVRYFTMRPLTLALSCAVASALVLGGLGSTTYLAMSSGAAVSDAAPGAGVQQAYEDRIASLRFELDRVVSRQLLDRQAVETKVDALLGQQLELTARYEKLQPLLERARSNGLLPKTVPLPREKPEEEHSALEPAEGPEGSPLSFQEEAGNGVLARFAAIDGSAIAAERKAPLAASPVGGWKARAGLASGDLIHEIGRSIDDVEHRQIAELDDLADGARRRADDIAGALRDEGIRVADKAAAAATGEGGPFVPVPEDRRFEASLNDLDTALTMLQAMRTTSDRLPLEAPLASSRVSSPFGIRTDPFLGRSAMHTGMDFVAATGTAVKAAAPGKVIRAGFNGGYGQMVEVDHGGGLISRYGHLSSILVSAGDVLSVGSVIGKVGSTGRSTGPHLHYEIRRDGEAVDPDRFLRAGRRINALG